MFQSKKRKEPCWQRTLGEKHSLQTSFESKEPSTGKANSFVVGHFFGAFFSQGQNAFVRESPCSTANTIPDDKEMHVSLPVAIRFGHALSIQQENPSKHLNR